VYLNDITERKGVEEKIRRSEETNRLLFENAVDPMLLIDEKARLVRVNKKIEEILGYKREDFIGKNIFSIGLIEKSSLKVIMKNLQRRAKGEDVPPYDVELISSDGDVKTFELNASRLEKGNKRANIMVILRDKTERNKIQSELRESEARYRNVLENMDYGYYEVDTKGDLTFFNNSLCKILGYTRAELVGMNNRKYMEPDVARSVFNKFNQIYNTGKTEKSFSYKVIRKDGEVRSVEASISSMENATGNKVGFRGIVRDITEKIRFEEEFAEFSRINNLIFENAVDPMIVIDRKGKIIRMNRKIETDLGYTKDDYLGKNIFKIGLIAQDSIITAIAQLQRRLRGEESKPYDVNLVHREGGVIPYELNASWFEEDGKLIGDIIIMRDISERKEAEEALKIEQGKYKNVVENIGEGIIVANDRGYITFTNSETEKILRYEIDGLIGKHINEVSSDSTKKMILPLMNNVLKGNNIHDFEMELLRKDGSPLIVELTISPRLEDGKITEMMGIIRDITEKKHAEEMIDLERMKYKNVVENIGDGLFVSDENGSVTYANPAAEK
ncbi:MAG: PAS domain S-box protein, partial [Halobacteriota archaeon]|nr:PAS domain S-box protein [Halobacteriota archaeon]